jgi:hypothetical protein
VGSATGADFDHGKEGDEIDEQPVARTLRSNARAANISVLIRISSMEFLQCYTGRGLRVKDKF